MDDRTRRIADNESRFREINERLRADLRSLPLDADPVDFICECGRVDCTQTVKLTLQEYESIRESSVDFFVVPGHQAPDVEDVIDFNDRYARVRKHPESAERVRESDPRR